MALNGQFYDTNNNSKRVAVIVCLDVSSSMIDYTKNGKCQKIHAVKKGLNVLKNTILNKDKLKDIVDLAIVTYSSNAEIYSDFKSIDKYDSFSFDPWGNTLMSEGLNLTFKTLKNRLDYYTNEGIEYYTPILLFFTDGEPNKDNINDTNKEAKKFITLANSQKIKYLAIGVGKNANINYLKTIFLDNVYSIDSANYDELFENIGHSIDRFLENYSIELKGPMTVELDNENQTEEKEQVINEIVSKEESVEKEEVSSEIEESNENPFLDFLKIDMEG